MVCYDCNQIGHMHNYLLNILKGTMFFIIKYNLFVVEQIWQSYNYASMMWMMKYEI